MFFNESTPESKEYLDQDKEEVKYEPQRLHSTSIDRIFSELHDLEPEFISRENILRNISNSNVDISMHQSDDPAITLPLHSNQFQYLGMMNVSDQEEVIRSADQIEAEKSKQFSEESLMESINHQPSMTFNHLNEGLLYQSEEEVQDISVPSASYSEIDNRSETLSPNLRKTERREQDLCNKTIVRLMRQTYLKMFNEMTQYQKVKRYRHKGFYSDCLQKFIVRTFGLDKKSSEIFEEMEFMLGTLFYHKDLLKHTRNQPKRAEIKQIYLCFYNFSNLRLEYFFRYPSAKLLFRYFQEKEWPELLNKEAKLKTNLDGFKMAMRQLVENYNVNSDSPQI